MAGVSAENWLEAQYSVLGSALIQPKLVPKILQETRPEDFSGSCRTVYDAMVEIYQSGQTVDLIPLAHKLGAAYREFLTQLMQITPTAANLDTYIPLCREQARLAKLQGIGIELQAVQTSKDAERLLADANEAMAQRPGLRIVTMAEALTSFYNRHQGKTNYLSWPISQLDNRLYTEPGDLVIIAGLPSAGKSAWAMQCAWHWSRDKKVGFFSLETGADRLFDRQMSAVTGISKDSIKRNELQETEWTKVAHLSDEITRRQLEIIPAAGMSAGDVKAITQMRGYEIIFVDYLQLLQSSGESRVTQVTNISIALHTLAQSMGVTVVALSQMARPNAQSKGAPEMSQLRESGQIEQDADVVMILKLRDEKAPDGQRELSIAKNKEGTRPKVLLDFDGTHQLFSFAGRPPEKAAMDAIKAKGKQLQQHPPARLDSEFKDLPDDIPVPFF